MARQSKQEKANDKRIEKLYYAHCAGLSLNITDIPKVFAFGQAEIAANAGVSDAALGLKIAAFVGSLAQAA